MALFIVLLFANLKVDACYYPKDKKTFWQTITEGYEVDESTQNLCYEIWRSPFVEGYKVNKRIEAMDMCDQLAAFEAYKKLQKLSDPNNFAE